MSRSRYDLLDWCSGFEFGMLIYGILLRTDTLSLLHISRDNDDI